MSCYRLSAAAVCAATFAFVFAPSRADAVPFFAHEYQLTCQKCHTAIPGLDTFGQAFLDHGYQLPDGVQAGKAFPISAKLNLAYSSAKDPTIPQAVVDELEIFLAGRVGDRANYFIEQYAVDGGMPGALRDGWVNRFTNPGASVPINVQAGQFTLPLPIDPESFRETFNHYAVWDQTVGDNSFNFFDPKDGARLRFGSGTRGTSVNLVAMQGHDKQSGLRTLGTDTMFSAQHVMGGLELSAYHYRGIRPDDDGIINHFTRWGYGLGYEAGKFRIDNVLQTGWDTSVDGLGDPGYSSGGFSQIRYGFNPKLFALARYDATNDIVNGKARSGTVLLGYRVSRNSRLTLEDVIQNGPTATHTFNTQYTVGY